MSRPSILVFCGGKGTRLGDLTKDLPKPMVDIHGKPFLYWLLKSLVNQGFDKILVSVSHQSEAITSYPWPWYVTWLTDSREGMGPDAVLKELQESGYGPSEIYICNGDTFLSTPIPQGDNSFVMVHSDTNSGVQYFNSETSIIRIVPCGRFYDIGTPGGLHEFRGWFKTHPLRVSE